MSASTHGDTPHGSTQRAGLPRLAEERAPILDLDAPGSPSPLRLLVVTARHDRDAPPARILAACTDDPGPEGKGLEGRAREEGGIEARLLCGAAGMEPPPGIRIFQPFADGSYLAEAEPGYDAADHSQHDADLLRRLGGWIANWPPDLVHLHDLAPFGVELIALIRRLRPSARILLSLSPELAEQLGITGSPRGFLHAAPLRRFLAEATLLLPCESLIPACLEFGLDPARLLVHAPLPRNLAEIQPPPPLGRFLVIACFPKSEAEQALLAATATLLARFPKGPLLELHGGWEGNPALADSPGLLLRPGAAPRHNALESAHLLLMPDALGADAESLARLALAMRRPVICAGQGPLARQVQAARDGWHCAMNATALADLLLDLAEAPERVAAMTEALLPPPSPAEGAAALFALYRELMADPARIAPPVRL